VRPDAGDLLVATVRAADDPATIAILDVVLVTVKLWGTETAACVARPLLGVDAAVVSLQNGVRKDDTLRDVLDAARECESCCTQIAKVATSRAKELAASPPSMRRPVEFLLWRNCFISTNAAGLKNLISIPILPAHPNVIRNRAYGIDRIAWHTNSSHILKNCKRYYISGL